jgi:PPOX class probable F420-dependent enzyme
MVALSAEARKIFEDKNFAFVATLNKDGSPQVTPTWVDTDGRNIMVNINTSRVKFANLKRDPRIAVAIVNMANPYKAFIIRGRVVSMEEGKNAEDHIDKMAKKYIGQEKYPFRGPNEHRVLVTIEPKKVTVWE